MKNYSRRHLQTIFQAAFSADSGLAGQSKISSSKEKTIRLKNEKLYPVVTHLKVEMPRIGVLAAEVHINIGVYVLKMSYLNICDQIHFHATISQCNATWHLLSD